MYLLYLLLFTRELSVLFQSPWNWELQPKAIQISFHDCVCNQSECRLKRSDSLTKVNMIAYLATLVIGVPGEEMVLF